MTATITQTPDAQAQSTDEQPFQDILSTMQKGWNAKSGQTFASVFDSKHDYVVVNGIYLSGITPEANAHGHQQLFNTVYRTNVLILKLDKIRFVRPDLVLMHVLGATYEQGKTVPVDPAVVISMLVEKKNDIWKVVSFHNCNIEVSNEPDAPNKSPIPFQAMYATWYKH
ncbi:SgcJ/EcaC family oxidoreductase [Spirosoma sp. BT702]|uniref:SgcJ/EcaC family oxidoreductase n=2 Tax=Spirosoma profusum TaxID=2771354 RepID=A0A927ASF1_9BACT|nr:SgcJ/EcaC family oxidoreductase [Spirosoma profusum]